MKLTLLGSAPYGVSLASVPCSGSCRPLLVVRCGNNMALRALVVVIAACRHSAAAVLSFKRRRRQSFDLDLSLLVTRNQLEWPFLKILFGFRPDFSRLLIFDLYQYFLSLLFSFFRYSLAYLCLSYIHYILFYFLSKFSRR
jgi:hypothetical protein